MKLIVLSMLAVCAFCKSRQQINLNAEWEEWKTINQKSYVLNDEETKRQLIWEQNYNFVMKHNYKYDLGKHTYTVGMNKFADLTSEEFKLLYLSNFGKTQTSMKCVKETDAIGNIQEIPKAVDWREKGYVTPVQNQGLCGSSWAFCVTGSVEGQHFNATGELVSLSEQNLVDCVDLEGEPICQGGPVDCAFEYIIKNKGIDTEASYPSKAAQCMPGPCMFDPETVGATISSCVDLPAKDEIALQKAVANVGPISVLIDAGHVSFQLYQQGVYYEPMCNETELDHGVLVVGYGADAQDYWLIKNSWGKDWGLQGYIKMSRNKNNNCGIATSASYPLV